jgi:hypothetical protein
MKRQIVRLTLILGIALIFLYLSPGVTGKASGSEPPANYPPGNISSEAPNISSQNCSTLNRIHFAPGTTSAEVSGNLAANTCLRYVLRAFAGQLMEVDLSAPESVSLSITTDQGRAIVPITGSRTSFRGYLPGTGAYIITVWSGSQPVSYSMNIAIPQRVSFELGATSASVQGRLDRNQSHDYILWAQAGQLMEISVTPEGPENGLQLIIYGVDGTVLRSGMGEGAFFRGELPLSEDYIVTVRAGNQPVAFNMSVIIPQRISFRPGAFSGSASAWLNPYHSQYYVLRARQNQTMYVDVVPGNVVQLIIYGADGTVLKSGMGEGTSFTGVLPSTQDYILVVRSGNFSVSYTIWVTIR